MSNQNNKHPSLEQRALAGKIEKKKPTMGPKKRAMHCLFYIFYGVTCFSWVSGLYDWGVRGEDADTAIKTLSLFVCVWGIWDIITMNDSE